MLSPALSRALEKGAKLMEDNTLVITHKDADGMLSYSLLNHLDNVNCMFLSQLTDPVLENIPMDFDSYVFVDLGNGFEKKIYEIFNSKKVIILEHHNSEFKEVFVSSKHLNINSYLFGINGNNEISSTGLSYLLVKKKHPFTFTGYFYVPVAGAYGDMQTKEGFIGLNAIFLNNALIRNEIYIEKTLSLPGVNLKPLHKSLKLFFDSIGIEVDTPYILNTLSSIGITPYKMHNMKRVPIKVKDLTEDEKIKLATHLAIFLKDRGMEEEFLFRNSYVIKDKYLLEEFVTLVNSCVKLGKINDGLELILEMKDKYEIYEKYIQHIGKAFNKAYRAIKDTSGSVLWYIFNKPELKEDSLTGTIATMLNSKLECEVVVVGYDTGEDIKFSIRSKSIDVGILTRTFCSKHKNCYGNGHTNAAGGIMPKTTFYMFVNYLKDKVRK